MLLQTSPTVAEKSADMLVKDPHGAIITLVSVTVVFAALVILYFAYTFIGKLSSGEIKLKKPEKKAEAGPGKAGAKNVPPKKPEAKKTEVRKPEPKRQLEVQWKTFRNKLHPGSQEQWTLKVLRPDGTPADARFMATM